ncbi:MAG TPA: hypothetical protein VFK02_07230 [Kofleriaceae bacterium]|nr:hypothetical protein [Kofleriaceae bacterium]
MRARLLVVAALVLSRTADAAPPPRPPAVPAAATAPDSLPLTQNVQLLGGRLGATLPAAMKLEARRRSIMSAEAAAEDETRAVLDHGAARFVMMTYELFALAGPDLAASIRDDRKAQGQSTRDLRLVPLSLARPLTALADIPPPTTGDADANLVYAAWVASPDGTVQYLAFYVNPAGAKTDAASWALLARQIVQRLTAGKRTLDTKAAAHKLGAGTETVTVATPDGWIVTTQPGPDFTVHHLRKLARLGGPAVSCGIYLGDHPSFQHRQSGIDAAKVKTSPATLFRAATTWQTWSADGSRFTSEAMTRHPGGSATVHAWCSADTEPELTDLRKIIETIR